MEETYYIVERFPCNDKVEVYKDTLEYETEDDRTEVWEEFVEGYDDSPMIGTYAFFTEKEFKDLIAKGKNIGGKESKVNSKEAKQVIELIYKMNLHQLKITLNAIKGEIRGR